jgi:hypothetical protein
MALLNVLVLSNGLNSGANFEKVAKNYLSA